MMRWWWFGPAVTHDELAKELDQMHSAGIGGVEIQPVYPLSVDDPAKGIKNLPYLSPGFLDAVTFANQKGPVPRHARGHNPRQRLALRRPAHHPHQRRRPACASSQKLCRPLPSVPIPQLAQGESLIAAFQVSGSPQNYDPSSAKQLRDHPRRDHPPQSLPESNQTALFFIASHTKQTVKRPSVGAEGLVLDHFSRAAINAHLADVATPLLSAFSRNPPVSVFSDSLEAHGADWTPNLLTEFRNRRGYDLTPHLPELAHGGTPQSEAIRHDWGLTLSDLIRENYLLPVSNFALAHHTNFRSQTYGEPAVTLSDEAISQLPEGEGPQWRTFSFTRWASSASHLYNRRVTSAETWTWLHSPAFRATPLDMKVEADRMFLQGVNQIVGHGWPYSPSSISEPGWSLYAAAVFNAHNPWWPVVPSIMNYLHRASWLLQQGEPANDVAILLPEDDAQAAFSPGHVSVTDEMKRRITPSLMSAILDAGYNVDYTDAETIIRVGIRHRILILPPTERIPLAAVEKIVAYAKGGGRIIIIGQLPALAPGLREQGDSRKIASTMSKLIHQSGNAVLIHSIADLPKALHEALPPDLSINPPVALASDRNAGLGFIHRILVSSDIYFVVNSTNQSVAASIVFRAKHNDTQRWDLDSGLAVQTTGAEPLPLHLEPYESAVFVLTNSPGVRAAPEARPVQRRGISTGSPAPSFKEVVQNLNANWAIQFPGERPQTLSSLGSWTSLRGRSFFSGEAIYTSSFSLQDKPPGAGRVLLDFGIGNPTVDTRPADAPGIHANLDPPIREAALVFVNGRPAGTLWHPPYRLNVTQYLQAGANHVEVHVFNTAINELAGQPPRDYSALEAQYGRRFVPQDMDNLKALPSGLLGPVTLRLEGAAQASRQ